MFFGSLQDHLFGVPNLADFGVQVGSGTPYLEYMDLKMGIKPTFCHKKISDPGHLFWRLPGSLIWCPNLAYFGVQVGPGTLYLEYIGP